MDIRTKLSNFLDSWTFFFVSRAAIGAVPAVVAWCVISNLVTLLGTR
jgi:hypothetical protein